MNIFDNAEIEVVGLDGNPIDLSKIQENPNGGGYSLRKLIISFGGMEVEIRA